MSRSNIRIQNLTRITSDDLTGDDVVPIGTSDGSAAKAIKVSELEKAFESDGLAQIIQEVSANYQILITDDIIFCDGTFTVTLAAIADAEKQVTIRNVSGTTTIDPSGADTTEQTTLTVGQSVTLAPRDSNTTWYVI